MICPFLTEEIIEIFDIFAISIGAFLLMCFGVGFAVGAG